MMHRVIWLAVTVAAAVVLVYLSRFWVFDLWGRQGLFGVQELRPQGDLLSLWLRGTGAAPFELLIWAISAFLVLTGLEKLYGLLTKHD